MFDLPMSRILSKDLKVWLLSQWVGTDTRLTERAVYCGAETIIDMLAEASSHHSGQYPGLIDFISVDQARANILAILEAQRKRNLNEVE